MKTLNKYLQESHNFLVKQHTNNKNLYNYNKNDICVIFYYTEWNDKAQVYIVQLINDDYNNIEFDILATNNVDKLTHTRQTWGNFILNNHNVLSQQDKYVGETIILPEQPSKMFIYNLIYSKMHKNISNNDKETIEYINKTLKDKFMDTNVLINNINKTPKVNAWFENI